MNINVEKQTSFLVFQHFPEMTAFLPLISIISASAVTMSLTNTVIKIQNNTLDGM